MKPQRPPVRLGALISGRGSNMLAIAESIRSRSLNAELAVVISNKITAAGLAAAEALGIPTAVVTRMAYPDREAHDGAVVDILKTYDVELVVLAGYMRVVTPTLLRAFPNRVMNIHPSLLPAFPGLHAQQQALEHGAKLAGCTVHFVSEGVDEGPIILQKCVPILEGDTLEALETRILQQEHRAYSEAIGLYTAGRLSFEGRRVRIAPENA